MHESRLDTVVEHILARIDGPLLIGAPLGLGKPHRLLNALYERVETDPSRSMTLYTALSLDPPIPGSGLEERFARPFIERMFGEDFPRLAYVDAMRRNALPAHIEVEEFYLQSGAMLASPQAQRHYASLNYTQVVQALVERGVNCMVQKVATNADGSKLSLSSNTDLSFDLLDALARAGRPRPLLVAEIDPQLPWLDGDAVVDAEWFDIVALPPAPYPRLFGLPRQPVGDAEYAIGLHASTLVRDGGMLQVGIGALSDALCHALVLRHTDNAAYRRALAALDPELSQNPIVHAVGGLEPFAQGLYGCSEMINEGFRILVDTGVIRRKVVDKASLMQRINTGTASPLDHELLERDGQFLHGAFYLGSQDFYAWLHGLDAVTRRSIGMKRISEVNQLYGLDQELERLQRRDGRFFNTCMLATALGAATSDALEDGRVVSGVGGQYNFVAMAHALPDGRSVLMLRATREQHGTQESNLRWAYGHTTIPRHLRDIYITEYGIADLRGKVDEECVIGMCGIAHADSQSALLAEAKAAGKLTPDFIVPPHWRRNTPDQLRARLSPLRKDGTLPDYPLGSDFSAVEQRLLRALNWLKRRTATRTGRFRTTVRALLTSTPGDAEAMQRMQLAAPNTIAERILARLLALGLAESAR